MDSFEKFYLSMFFGENTNKIRDVMKALRRENNILKMWIEHPLYDILDEYSPSNRTIIKCNREYLKVTLKSYFPKGYTSKQMQDTIEKLLKQYQQRWKNRDLGR